MADKNTTYAQRYYQAALDFFDQGQYGKAIEHINKAIEKAPKNADYLSTKGVFLHKMNDLGQAIESYRAALEAVPGHAFTHFNLGLIFMKMGKTQEAIQEWKAVIKVNPMDVNALFNIAVSLAQLGNKKDAINYYEQVLKAQPNHIQTHQNLGILYRDDRKFDKAKHHLHKLRDLDATYSEVVTAEIIRCDEEEFIEKTAQFDLTKILSETSFPKATLEQMKLQAALRACILGNNALALEIADQLLAQIPGDVQVRIIRGQALRGLGRKDDAIAELMGALVDNPSHVELHFHLGNLFLEMDVLEKALEHFSRVKKLDPTFPLMEENIRSLESKISKGIKP